MKSTNDGGSAPESRRFVTPIYRGPRFENHRLPVDLLGDLVVYRELVVDVARALFRSRHPDRKRLPKNFDNRFQLALGSVEEGSTIAALERTHPDEMMLWTNVPDEFDEARDLIAETIEAARENRALPLDFPQDLLYRFNGFGAGLRDDESVELLRPGNKTGPRYDRSLRKRMVLTGSKTYEDHFDQTVWVVAIDFDKKLFEVKLDTGQRISCRLGPMFQSQVMDAANQQVRLVGVGEFDAHDRVRAILQVNEMVPVDDDLGLDMSARIDQLGRLPEGWLDGVGQPLSRDGLERLRGVLDHLVKSQGLRPPFLYPTPDGEVRAEWSFKDHEVSATFDLERWEVWLHASSSRTEFAQELTVGADDSVAISQFVHQFEDRRRTSNE